MKLTAREIKQYRERQLQKQGFVCPLCNGIISFSEAALDHDHKTGLVRKVLHRWCNSVLGRVENWAKRSPVEGIEFLESAVAYLKVEHTQIEHPNHGKTRKRKRAKRVKRPRVTRQAVPKRKASAWNGI